MTSNENEREWPVKIGSKPHKGSVCLLVAYLLVAVDHSVFCFLFFTIIQSSFDDQTATLKRKHTRAAVFLPR